jgi:hypothetical protein
VDLVAALPLEPFEDTAETVDAARETGARRDEGAEEVVERLLRVGGSLTGSSSSSSSESWSECSSVCAEEAADARALVVRVERVEVAVEEGGCLEVVVERREEGRGWFESSDSSEAV